MENNIKLLVNNISVVYSDVIQVLKGVSLIIRAGQIVSHYPGGPDSFSSG